MTDTPALTTPKRVMALFAHPDDPEFFAGGTLLKWADAGAEMVYVLATSGDKGTDDPTMTAERLMAQREAEQRAAATHTGCTEVVFLRHPDGELEHTLAFRRDLTRVIRQFTPDVVVTNDPAAFYFRNGSINHSDHMAVGATALAAVYPAARDRHYFVELWRDEGLEPHKVRHVYLAGTQNPGTKVIITDVFERKLAAILEHRSQVREPEALIKRMRGNFDPDFGEHPPVYTEQFRVLTLRM